ncbi:MAG: hypothetical protein HC934_11645 [Acaryochloridaceae cyanobacterium SU_2_1]|nr:hypothetical protein [Acaryochloridaceae cyanobacterium SU_2_1]
MAIVILANLTEFAGVLAWALAQQRCYASGMGKSDRALVFGMIALGIGSGIDLNPWLSWIWPVVILLQLVTIANRLRITLKAVESC